MLDWFRRVLGERSHPEVSVWSVAKPGQHVLLKGCTGAGLSETLISAASEAIRGGDSIIYIDGLCHTGLWAKLYGHCEAAGRLADQRVVNFIPRYRGLNEPEEPSVSNTIARPMSGWLSTGYASKYQHLFADRPDVVFDGSEGEQIVPILLPALGKIDDEQMDVIHAHLHVLLAQMVSAAEARRKAGRRPFAVILNQVVVKDRGDWLEPFLKTMAEYGVTVVCGMDACGTWKWEWDRQFRSIFHMKQCGTLTDFLSEGMAVLADREQGHPSNREIPVIRLPYHQAPRTQALSLWRRPEAAIPAGGRP